MKNRPETPPPRDNWQSALEDTADFRDATPLERFRAFEAVLRLSWAVLARHPERQRLLDQVDPLPRESVALLNRLRNASTDDADA